MFSIPFIVEMRLTKIFSIILTQGLNRQIRRMCESLGYRVETLKRIRIMNISLGDLPVGTYRPLTEEEVRILGMLTEKRIQKSEKDIKKEK